MITVAIGASLGNWQTRRAHEKESTEHKLSTRETLPPIVLDGRVLDANAVEYRRVRIQGEFVRDWPVYLDNRPHEGVAGLYILMPFKIAGTDRYVLVARGWVPRNADDRTRLPPIPTPKSVVEIEGVAKSNVGHVLQLGQEEALRPHAILQNLDVTDFARASKLPMQPFLIEQITDTHDGLVRDWPRPAVGSETNRGYAFQWYALAALAGVFFVATGWRREIR